MFKYEHTESISATKMAADVTNSVKNRMSDFCNIYVYIYEK